MRSIIRKHKPESFPCCNGRVFHGHGWRCRSTLKSWAEWLPLWYWRVQCQTCGAVHCLVPDIVTSDLVYKVEVVSEVIVGRLAGREAKEFEPHRRTQQRWLDRIQNWWPVAQSCGAIEGSLKEWSTSIPRLLEAIHICASHHVGLFFPSRSERAKRGVSPRRKYPMIATHQMCSSTEVVLL
ncbi:MAG: DUF6431 domain-containing protein [Methanosarcinaceae archaeon]